MTFHPRLLAYLKPHWHRIIGALLAVLVMSVINVSAIPVVQQLAGAVAAKDVSRLAFWIAFILVMYVLRGISAYIQIKYSLYIGHSLVARLRLEVFAHLQTLSMSFYSQWKSGDLLSRMINDVQIVRVTLTEGFIRVLPHIFTPVGVIGYLLFLNWKLTLAAVALSSVVFISFSRFRQAMLTVSRKAARNHSAIAAFIQESLRGIKIIKAYGLESMNFRRMEQAVEDNHRHSREEARIIAFQEPLVGLFQILMVVILIGLGGAFIIADEMSPSQLVAFFIGLMLLIDPVRELSRLNVLLQRTHTSAERLFELLDVQPAVTEKRAAECPADIEGKVEFRGVSFRYEASRNNALDDISLVIYPGEMVALVGASGAGKTTLAELVLRFYDPSVGDIFIDDRNLRDISLACIRDHIGLVSQDTVLFSGTVRENIAIGKPGAADGAIEAAARRANAHGFITRLPGGYEAQIGENGVLLSEGERQRIAIARAFLKNPRILILDEITASLDSESEELIQDSLRRLVAGKTTLIIAHRLSTIRHADRILFMEHGKIKEAGHHTQLLERRGLYHRYYTMQYSRMSA